MAPESKPADFLPGFSLREETNRFAEPQEQSVDDSVLSESDRAILDYLRKEGDSQFDSISAGTGIRAESLSRKLVALEISHRIERRQDGSYRRIR